MIDRVIFLDVDGVLITLESMRRFNETFKGAVNFPSGMFICPKKLQALSDLCKATRASVVISSTWRKMDYPLEEADTKILNPYLWLKGWLKYFDIPIHPDEKTIEGDTISKGGVFISCIRGDEIQEWLNRHPEIKKFAIIDDDSDMRPDQISNFVKTQFETGLNGSAGFKIREIFRGG